LTQYGLLKKFCTYYLQSITELWLCRSFSNAHIAIHPFLIAAIFLSFLFVTFYPLFKIKTTNMGHFTIHLPDNRQGDVRWGNVRKLQFPLLGLTGKKKEAKTGYIVTVDPAVEGKTAYTLFKTKEGRWSQDPNGKQLVEDMMSIAIKEAIEQHENQHTE
jgi:hypothetical protein